MPPSLRLATAFLAAAATASVVQSEAADCTTSDLTCSVRSNAETSGQLLVQKKTNIARSDGAVLEDEADSELTRGQGARVKTFGLGQVENAKKHEAELARALERAAEGKEEVAQGASNAVFSCPASCSWCSRAGGTPSVQTLTDIKYGEAISLYTGQPESLFLDFYTLGNDERRPVVIVTHGGGFMQESNKASGWAPLVARTFAEYGFGVASIEYRRNANYCNQNWAACWNGQMPPLYSEPVHDTLAAVRYISENAEQLGVDASKIVLFGCSAGGITTANTLMYDFGAGASGSPGVPYVISGGISLSGGMSEPWVTSMRQRRKTAGVAPYLAFHNQDDSVTPYSMSTQTKQWLDDHGLENTLVTLPGSGHCPNIFGSGGRMEDMLGFMVRAMRLGGGSCPGQTHAPAPAPPAPAPQSASAGSFEMVDGGTNRACRGANSRDNSEAYYRLKRGLTLEACKQRCVGMGAACKGIEHGGRRCELWIRLIEASVASARNRVCLRYTV